MGFKKGQSGNPKGRPKGALNKTTLAAQQLLAGEAQEITQKVIELAKQGNPMALKLCLERILPRRKDRLISLNLPKVKTEADVFKALQAILAAVSRGDITPNEADILSGLVGETQKVIKQLPPEPAKDTLTAEDFSEPGVRDAYLAGMIAYRTLHERVEEGRRRRQLLATRVAPQDLLPSSEGTAEPEGQEERETQDERSPVSPPFAAQGGESC